MLIKELQILTEALWESVKKNLDFFSSISSFVKKMAEFNYSDLTKNDLLEISIYINNIESFFSRYRSSGSSSSLYIPPKQTSTNDSTVKRIGAIVKSLDQMSEQELEAQINDLKPKKVTDKNGKRKKVFIGHGRSKLWARVQLFLKDDLDIESLPLSLKTKQAIRLFKS